MWSGIHAFTSIGFVPSIAIYAFYICSISNAYMRVEIESKEKETETMVNGELLCCWNTYGENAISL